MKTLNLTLKKKWFDMIASGEKKDEYRELKDYWKKRLISNYEELEFEEWGIVYFNDFDTITFRNGYAKDAPTMVIECEGITIGKARPEWSDNWQGDVFIIKLGKIISNKSK